MMNTKKATLQYGGLMCFLFCLILAFLMFLPYIIADNGYFIYYGDYNAQQIPFYQLAHDAIRNGEIGWNWITDLGANFIGSYSFYLLGSPFFWLTIPFPSEAVPYLMAPLLMLKFACCGLSSYYWLKTLVKKAETAVLGGILYAFCGFNLFNIFFNHFLEPVVVFPLLLLALDAVMIRNRFGVLAPSIALCLFVNYYFFFGQAVFLILYYLVNLWSGRYQFKLKTFLVCAAESILGVLLSAALLLPSLLAILGNDRLENVYLGMRMLFYNNEQRYGLIAESLFLIPDIPACANLFSDSNAKWASVSLYVPLFTLTGVAVYFKNQQKTWLKRLLCICIPFALIPVLNSMFSAMNANFYARWYYMPTLLIILCTLHVVEEPSWNTAFGLKVAGIGVALLAFFAILPSDQGDDGIQWFKLPTNRPLFWESIAVAVLSLLCLLLLRVIPRKKKIWKRFCAGSLALIILLSGNVVIKNGRSLAPDDVYDRVVTRALEASDFQGEDDGHFYRVDFDDDAQDNTGMFWNLDSIQCFHSIVPASVMDFYQSIGVSRDVASRPDPSYYGVRGLTSVKYRMVPESSDTDAQIPGFAYDSTQNGFLVYKNLLYIPMGFTYDYSVDEDLYETCDPSMRDRLMLKGMYLDSETMAKVGNYLTPLGYADLPDGTNEDYAEDCLDRAASASESFTVEKNGFTCQISLNRDNLVFFSVPYEEGWSAEVNGIEAEIYEVNVGFMAVVAPKGENTITFTYQTPGKNMGLEISVGALILFGGYTTGLWIVRRRKKKVN